MILKLTRINLVDLGLFVKLTKNNLVDVGYDFKTN